MVAGDLYRVLWHRKAIVLLTVALLITGAIYYTSRETKQYTASTLVRIQQKITNSGEAFGALQTGGRLAQTYAEIAGTTSLAQKVYVGLDGKVPLDAIAGSISGTQIEDLDLLSLSVTTSRPEWAQAIANEAPDALRRFIKQTGTLRDQVVTIQPAALPRGPSAPSMKLHVAEALVLGLLFGSGLALLFEFVADRAHGAEEIERITRRPVLSTVGKLDLVRVAQLGDPPLPSTRDGGEVSS
jgi:capsular polysaccharide biosynthesis protein